MPHGDPSDLCGLGLVAAGVQLLMYPGVVASDKWIHERYAEPVPELDDARHAQLLAIIAGLYIVIGFTLVTV